MSVVVAEGVVIVDADAKGVPKKIADDVESGSGQLNSAGQGMGRSIFGGLVAAYAAIGGTQAIVGFFSNAITGASDLNETLSKSEVIFGSNARSIEQWGDTAARTVGLSKEAAIAAAAGFGDMFTQLGFTDNAAADMSKSVVQAAADLGSFSNLDTADVADRISAAFRGEYDSLQAVIPNINAARVESEALAATGKTTADSLTAQEKAAAVLAIVQGDGARAMGDFERTSDGVANKQKILTAEFENQTTALGTALLPAWNNVLSMVNTVALPAFSWLVDNLPLVGSVLGGLAVALLVVFAPAIWGAVTATWAFTTALLANPITWVIIGITALVAGIIWLATQTTFFQDVWTSVTTAIGTAWDWLWTNILEPTFNAIGAIFEWLYNNIIMPIVTGIMIYIGIWAAIFEWLWNTILSPIFAAIGAIFQWIWNSIIMPIVGFIQLNIQALGIVFQWLYQTIIQPVFQAVGAAFQWVWGTIIQPIVNLISGAITNVGNTVRSVFGGIGEFIGSAVQTALHRIRGPNNRIIPLVNSAITGLNSLKVTIPDWVPIVGGQTWGLSIPKIPMLATGGNIWRSGSVIVGERGPEILNLPAGASVHPLTGEQKRGGGGDAPLVGGDLIINEAEDPLGSAGRVAAELRKWRKR